MPTATLIATRCRQQVSSLLADQLKSCHSDRLRHCIRRIGAHVVRQSAKLRTIVNAPGSASDASFVVRLIDRLAV